ncbi:MAG: hypothetical protein ABJC04_02085 [Verrucomicrobiota bacterium]
METRFKDEKDVSPKTGRGIDANRDPITGEPGSHPVGTGVGAASAGATGAIVGAAVGGPIGGVVGAIVGSIAGGYAGKALGEVYDPTVEDSYWRENYANHGWVEDHYTYEDYQPAFRAGYEGYGRYGTTGKSYADVQMDLAEHYEKNRGKSPLNWDKAQNATRAAWERVENANAAKTDSLK